jgi:hypothetical protein
MPKPTYTNRDFTLTIVTVYGKTRVQWACVWGSDDVRQRRWIRFQRDWLRALSMTEWPDAAHARACIRGFAKAERKRFDFHD